MTLSIILLNYYSDKHTLECLQSLKELNWNGKLHIIVSDNGSKNNFSEKLKKLCPSVKY